MQMLTNFTVCPTLREGSEAAAALTFSFFLLLNLERQQWVEEWAAEKPHLIQELDSVCFLLYVPPNVWQRGWERKIFQVIARKPMDKHRGLRRKEGAGISS